MEQTEQRYSPPQVARLLGINYRRLDRALMKSGTGYPRAHIVRMVTLDEAREALATLRPYRKSWSSR